VNSPLNSQLKQIVVEWRNAAEGAIDEVQEKKWIVDREICASGCTCTPLYWRGWGPAYPRNRGFKSRDRGVLNELSRSGLKFLTAALARVCSSRHFLQLSFCYCTFYIIS